VKLEETKSDMKVEDLILTAFNQYGADLSDNNLLKELIIDKVKHVHGEEISKQASTNKLIDDLIAKK